MKLIAVLLLFTTLPASGTQADSLGRLFFTPEQRAQLEFRHARNATAGGSNTPIVLTVNGVVQQHDGARTVWINGAAQDSGQGGEAAAEGVAVPGKSKTVEIRVGQRLLLDTTAAQPASAE